MRSLTTLGLSLALCSVFAAEETVATAQETTPPATPPVTEPAVKQLSEMTERELQQAFSKAYQTNDYELCQSYLDAMRPLIIKKSGEQSQELRYLISVNSQLCYRQEDYTGATAILQSLLDGTHGEPTAAEKRSFENAIKQMSGTVKEEEYRKRDAAKGDLPLLTIHTSRGPIALELFEDDAPNTVANFIQLAESNFFNNCSFHRVIDNFMIQGGDPNSKDTDPSNDGLGDAGYFFPDEVTENHRIHTRGTLSMANSGPNTNSSQFFITHVPTPHLNGKHTVFGRVLQGLDIVDSVQQGDSILSMEVTRKRDHEYAVQNKLPNRRGQ